jgi:putative transposase
MSAFYFHLRHFTKSFRLCLAPFLQGSGLPFAEALTEEQIAAAFAAEGVAFGESEGAVYTPSITLWAFLSQVLHGGELRSCAAAVSRVIVLLLALEREPCSTDTGAYCRARAKLPEKVLQRLTCDTGRRLEAAVPEAWLWYGRHVKLVDGTTATMPDTPCNQRAYPQNTAQQPGLGFPIVRMVLLLSLATAAVCGAAFGPYAGKETGESALLRSLLNDLNPGDILLGDRYYCSYFLLALASLREVDWAARLHQRRKTDFRRGRCVGQSDHLVTWHRPQRPDWMDENTYALIPKTMTVREIKVQIHEPGFRVEEFVVATTLLNPWLYPTAAIAELYHYRWNAELDLRALKQSLALEPLHCKSPEMVRKELWTCWLAYNLIRKTIAQAAQLAAKLPRQISFAGARQTLAASWDRLSTAAPAAMPTWSAVQLTAIASREVGNRPNRVEPRAIKRRPKPHKLLKIPRREARKELLTTGRKRRVG